MFRKSIPVALLCCSGLLFQCSDSGNNPQPVHRDLTVAEKALVTSDNAFGLKLFREIVRQEGNKNIFVSPLSFAMALGMTYNGANGTTREAMQKTLELQGMSLEDVNKSYRSLIDLLRQLDPNVNFQLANSIWYRQGFEVESAFANLNQTYFDAAVQALDFADPAALTTINNWVNSNTNGKIKTILDRIPDDALMYLINAIYFKGAWTTRFDANKTRDWSFTLSDGSTKSCRMMYMSDAKFTYFATESFSAADLKYGSGDYSMTILLPNSGANLDSLVEQITDENWRDWLTKLQPAKFDLGLPKFELEYDLLANDVLKALGMGIAFSDFADFTGINRQGNLLISEVKHKTYVKVNEEGTEAAAVTSVEIRPTSMPSSFVVDRPFLFVIHENRSGTILFIGKIVDPT